MTVPGKFRERLYSLSVEMAARLVVRFFLNDVGNKMPCTLTSSPAVCFFPYVPPPPHARQQKDERTWTQNADSARAYQLDRNAATCNGKRGRSVSSFLLTGGEKKKKSIFPYLVLHLLWSKSNLIYPSPATCIICVRLHTWRGVSAGQAFRCICACWFFFF